MEPKKSSIFSNNQRLSMHDKELFDDFFFVFIHFSCIILVKLLIFSSQAYPNYEREKSDLVVDLEIEYTNINVTKEEMMKG